MNKFKFYNVFGIPKRYYSNVNKKNANVIRESNVLQIGQRNHLTHPKLFGVDDVTPCIKRSEYEFRRQTLMDAIRWYAKKQYSEISQHLVVVPSSSKQYMSDKIPYFFRQNTEFLYLTGCLEPDSCLVLYSDGTSDKHISTLFLQGADPQSELWDGPRTSEASAPSFFGVDQGLVMTELQSFLKCYISNKSKIGVWYDFTTSVQSKVHEIMNDNGMNLQKNKLWESPKLFLHQQRLFKSPSEVHLMKRSCEMASDAIKATIEYSKPGINEHELFAKVDFESRLHGAEYLAYPPVVAGGNRANIIHYITNNQVVNDGEMVLMDAGCELHGYSSDITRTWPINGNFTNHQRELYEIVLETQLELIEACNKFPSLDKLFEIMCASLGKKLQQLGLLSKLLAGTSLTKAVYDFCPHHVSHYLGMDVHDTPTVTRNIPIKPGMIITIEPGIYINEKNGNVPKAYRGIGIRIEDDVLITEDGPIVLTKPCPKTIDEIQECANSFSPIEFRIRLDSARVFPGKASRAVAYFMSVFGFDIGSYSFDQSFDT